MEFPEYVRAAGAEVRNCMDTAGVERQRHFFYKHSHGKLGRVKPAELCRDLKHRRGSDTRNEKPVARPAVSQRDNYILPFL